MDGLERSNGHVRAHERLARLADRILPHVQYLWSGAYTYKYMNMLFLPFISDSPIDHAIRDVLKLLRPHVYRQTYACFIFSYAFCFCFLFLQIVSHLMISIRRCCNVDDVYEDTVLFAPLDGE